MVDAAATEPWQLRMIVDGAGEAVAADSRTGALGLYEKVWMKVTSTWVNLAIEL
jgi:hypothetical protein